MERVKLEVEFVTPCFLGGADNKANAEWRGASIRGQLRWWFRALAGGAKFGNLSQVAELEGQLFGTTERAGALKIGVMPPTGGLPATFGLSKNASDLARSWGRTNDQLTINRLTLRKNGNPVNSNPVAYLGYGAVNFRGDAERGSIPAGATAILCIQLARNLAPGLETLLRDAIWCWVHLGGIGAKNRKGYGSLRCISAPSHGDLGRCFARLDSQALTFFEDKVRFLRSTYGGMKGLPEWSHFSAGATVDVSVEARNSWQEAMELAGSWLVGFRRRYGMAGDERHEIANKDYEWAYNLRGSEAHKGYPSKAGFGLPLPFGRTGETIAWGTSGENRRASPLLIHIGKFDNGHRVVMTHLPARLIPNHERLKFKGLRTQGPEPQTPHYAIIGEFLQDLQSKHLLRRIDNA